MTPRIACALLALSLGFVGCADEELAPAPSESMTAPEPSHPREPHKTADPPPPMREQLKRSPSSLILVQPDAAPVLSASSGPSTQPPLTEPGTVNPLR